MNPKRKQRLILISAMVILVVVAVSLFLLAFKENMNLYFDPTRVVAGEAPQDHTFRIGGMVVKGSIVKSGIGNELHTSFDLTDYKETVTVTYDGILPDLFREEQGVVALGKLQGEVFVAEEVLAKHDENYMPPEVAASLKKDPPQTAN